VLHIRRTWSFVWGLSPQIARVDGTAWLPTEVYFENCITKPCQVGHTPFGCPAVITTSYVRR